jgi:hypothetical protein
MMRLAVAQSSPRPDSWWLQISAVLSVDWAHCTQSGISGPGSVARSVHHGLREVEHEVALTSADGVEQSEGQA